MTTDAGRCVAGAASTRAAASSKPLRLATPVSASCSAARSRCWRAWTWSLMSLALQMAPASRLSGSIGRARNWAQ